MSRLMSIIRSVRSLEEFVSRGRDYAIGSCECSEVGMLVRTV